MDSLVQDAMKGMTGDTSGLKIGQANISVIGCGGGGNNMVSWLHKKGIQGAKIYAINTDLQHLNITDADAKILIGRELTRGLGCGGYPQKGTEAAKESMHEIKSLLKDCDMAFVCAGLGGGTGTGSAHVVAAIARESGAIVIGTVTMPFIVSLRQSRSARLNATSL